YCATWTYGACAAADAQTAPEPGASATPGAGAGKRGSAPAPATVADASSTRGVGQVPATGPPVNGYDVLAKALALPISTWHYKDDPPGVSHLGPMAQDWYAAYGLGGTDRRMYCVDANGVSLLCIQALHRLLDEQQTRIDELQDQITELRAGLDSAGTGQQQ
ncbi:tail fiber domain-containing protein, partial [Streptomyces sp. NPDC002537]